MGSTSNPSFSPFGAEAMNAYFMASTSAGMPFPTPDHGGYGGGGLCFGDAAAVADIGAQFSANNMMLASLASQLFAHPQPHGGHGHTGARAPPEVEEMDGEYEVSGGDHGHSDAHAMAVCPSSSSKKPRCDDWSSAEGSRAVSVYGQYQLAGPPPQTAGFYYPPATPSELSLSLRSVSSSDSMSMASGGGGTDQFSSGSGLTHASSRVRPELSQSQQAYCPQPQARFRPVHFAVVVSRSPYAPVAQQVLNDAVGRLLHGVALAADDSLQASSCSAPSVVSSNNNHGARWGQAHSVRGELLRMLQLMDEKYNQCLDDIQSTTVKFNSLAQPGSGIGIGGIAAPFAHHAVSATYRALRRRITGEIMAAAGGSRPSHRGDSSMTSGSWESAFIQKHLAAQQARRREQHSWRPQRGLPEKSVAVLKSWLFENFVRPYPQDSEKDMLAERSGLTRTQVANWFINARVRLWRPLIEELHEELRRSSVAAPAMPMEHAVSQYVVG